MRIIKVANAQISEGARNRLFRFIPNRAVHLQDNKYDDRRLLQVFVVRKMELNQSIMAYSWADLLIRAKQLIRYVQVKNQKRRSPDNRRNKKSL